MRSSRRRFSHISKKAEVRAAHIWTHAMYGEGKPPQVVYADKPKRVRRELEPSAPPLERDVLKAVWKFLAHHPKVAWVTRINSGTVMADFGTDGIHPLRMNYKRGISDLIGQMRDGRFLACEVKREGADLMPHQREFLNEVRQHGGVAFVARNIQDVEQAMR